MPNKGSEFPLIPFGRIARGFPRFLSMQAE